MIYQDKDLPKGSLDNPYIFTNFVSTVDGKVQVIENWKSYWPIGSKTDYQGLTELRAFSDVLIQGSGTAKLFPIVKTIQTPKLASLRNSLGKYKILPFVVLSNNPNGELINMLRNSDGEKAYLITSKKSNVPKSTDLAVNLVRVGDNKIELREVLSFLTKKF